MGTMQRLNAYSSALEKWWRKKSVFDANVAAKIKVMPFNEFEPVPKTFEIGESEMEWAEKIRRKILAPKIV